MDTIPIAKIGETQKIDIEQSRGIVLHDSYARVCSVYKPTVSRIGDTSPHRIAKLFGGRWQDYNHHFVVQASGCPLGCNYCYVEESSPSKNFTAQGLVDLFIQFRSAALDCFRATVNVFHLMGGDPALYCSFWPILRYELDQRGCCKVILLSNTVLVESAVKGVQPWKYLDIHNFVLSGCLKGVNREDFIRNTGKDLYHVAVSELKHYIRSKNFYLTLVGQDKSLDWNGLYELIPKERIDFLKVVEYAVVKQRKSSGGCAATAEVPD